VAEGGFPNRNRADNALTIYRDAMRAYIAPILEREHGPDWIRSQVLNATARERNPNSYARREQSLKRGTPAQNLIDLADIPFLIQENRDAFPDLDQSDTRRMHMIRDLRNEIHHADRSGDCAPEEAESLAGLCTLVVERCGLSDAVENIRGLSLDGPDGGSTEADLREQRERREWDKARLAGKRPEELTLLEQQRLADIEWEEEWERRELARREREEIARFSDDLDGLRRWFNADEARRNRHPSEYATLLQQEQERRAQERREREQHERERRERERREQERRAQRASELRDRERAEIAAFGDDLNGLRRWFYTYKVRRKRHPSEYAELLQRERERERRERELQERERTEIAAFGDDVEGLHRWFDTDKIRRVRHPSKYQLLLRQENERREHERRERERRERELQERERTEIAAFSDDDEGLRRWFDADRARHNRHPTEHAALRQRERERQEQQAHERRERERLERARRERERERERRERIERERTEIAALGDDIEGLRRWFDADKARYDRHPAEHAGLRQRELERLEQRERAGIAALGDDIDGLRRWFDTDEIRQMRHPSKYQVLLRQEIERAEQGRRELEAAERERERAEIATFGNDIDGLRRWFDTDKYKIRPRREERYPSEYAALLQREQERREQAEIMGLGDDADGLRRWFHANTDRQQRHASAYAELKRRERGWRHIARRRLANVRAGQSRGKSAARQVSGLFARSLAMKVSVILAISFVLFYVIAVAWYGWPLAAGLEFAAVTWAVTLPGLVLAGHASYRFRTAYAGAVDEKTRRSLWNALLAEALAILAVSVLLIYVLVGELYGWGMELRFALELEAVAIPGLVLAGHTGYRFRSANDGAVTAKNGGSPAFLSKALFYLLGGLALFAVLIVVWIIAEMLDGESKSKK